MTPGKGFWIQRMLLMNSLSLLELTLHGRRVGHLAGYQNGKNLLLFAPEFIQDKTRPTLGLITHPDFPRSEELLTQDWVRHQRLHPLLSNLLPEGALRELLAASLKIHSEHEFEMLAWLGKDLPGALIARPIQPDAVPSSLWSKLTPSGPKELQPPRTLDTSSKFSLAGVQMKFSMSEKGGRYTLTTELANNQLGDWIIKTPSTHHRQVPANEYTCMTLARLAGIDLPDFRLIKLNQLDNLPPINLPQEEYAFAIRRFDRYQQADGVTDRIHMEDFAQVLSKYPHQKYTGGNHEHLGRILYQFSGDGITDAQEFARRILVNLLLANGDAHLKNWSLIYKDQFTPRLSPAYDILCTQAFMENEQTLALNLARNKHWYRISMGSFEAWAKKANIPWRLIQPHLQSTLEQAKEIWPQALEDLPMLEHQKKILIRHWKNLHPDFRLLNN